MLKGIYDVGIIPIIMEAGDEVVVGELVKEHVIVPYEIDMPANP